jgi:phage FluMu gp28-like protein
VGFEPDAKQMELLRRPVRRLLLNCTRQWGKSTITAAKAVERAHTRTGSLTLVVSPSARQSGEFLRKAAAFVRRLEIAPRGDGDNEISLLFPNGARIVGLPGTESTVRGFSAVSLLLIDEAARVGDEMYKAVRPMLAVGDGDLWLMSTPFGKRGFFWEEWSKGGPQWERIVVPATECPRIPASFLEEERASLGERWFRQEYLCEFVDTNDALFSRELVERAFTDEVEPLF